MHEVKAANSCLSFNEFGHLNIYTYNADLICCAYLGLYGSHTDTVTEDFNTLDGFKLFQLQVVCITNSVQGTM